MAGRDLSDELVAVQKPGGRDLSTSLPKKSSLMSDFADGAGNLLYGAAKGLADPVYGASQLLMHGANTLSGNRLQGMSDNYDKLISGVENQYQADTPGSVMAGIGRVAGNLAMPVKGAGALMGTSGLARAGGAALTGMGIGAMQPVANSSDYMTTKLGQIGAGGVTGGALSAAGNVIGSGINALRPVFSPSSAAGNQILGNLKKASKAEQANGAPMDVNGLTGSNPLQVLSNLQASKSLVPGSLPTTAQVAGSPELVMAEKILRNTPSYTPQFMSREASNNAARNQAVSNVAQTPEALRAAIMARSSAADPLYSAFNAQNIPIEGELSGLLQTPIGKDAVSRAASIAANKQQPLNLRAATAEQSVPSSIVGADGMPISTSTIPAQPGSMDGSAANLIKMSMDAMRRDVPTAGIASHEAGALQDVRNQFVNHLDGVSPTFKAARQAFAEGSVPVNTMTAGQELQTALSGGAMNYNGEVAPTLTKFGGKLDSIMGKQNYPIDPDAMSALQSVRQDLQRRSISDSVPKSGSDTVWNAQAPNWLAGQLFGKNLDGNSIAGRGLSAIGGFMTGGPMGAVGGAAVAQKAGQFLGGRVDKQLQDAMMNPDVFARLLQEALDRDGVNVSNGLAPLGARAAASFPGGLLSPNGP